MFEHIMHPSDLTETSHVAFMHALRLGIAARANIKMVHIASADPRAGLREFPGVRDTLVRWGLLAPGSERQAVADLGITLEKIVLKDSDPVHAIEGFMKRHETSLMVLASHRKSSWLDLSRAAPLAQRSNCAALFVPDDAGGIVDAASGEIRLGVVLVPLAPQPGAHSTFESLIALFNLCALESLDLHVVHVGTEATLPLIPRNLPGYVRLHVHIRDQKHDVVDAIVDLANEVKADLVAMPTAGRQSFLDILRGSTSEQVLARIRCPLLAVPASVIHST